MGDDRRASAGLVGFAARTGRTAVASPIAPRFFGAIDDPSSGQDGNIVAQPVFGADDQVHALLVGVRRANRAAFRAEELQLLARFAELVTPVFDQLSIQAYSQSILDESETGGALLDVNYIYPREM